MIDVLITSEIRIYSEGLGQILAGTDDINVLGTACSCQAVLDICAQCAPDVIILDMTMAGSYTLAEHFSQVSPEIKIVALAINYDEADILKCAEAGVTCYVPRDASVTELIAAMHEAAAGACYCPPKIAACILHKLQNRSGSVRMESAANPADEKRRTPTGSARKHRYCLTQREQQIARLLGVGLSNKQIARDLCIEVSTVKNHVHNVLVKLEAKNRSQAVFTLQERSRLAGSGSLDPDLA